MATFTRVNGIGNSDNGFEFQQGFVHYTQQNVKAWLIDLGEALTNKDADAAGEVNQSIEVAMGIVQPMIYFSANTATTITAVTDTSGLTAADIQLRLRAYGNVQTSSGNWANLAAAVVTSAVSLTAT